MRLESCSEGDWPALPCALQQHPLYGQAVRRMGGKVGMFRIMANGDEIGRLQVLFRRFGPMRLSWAGRGPVWNSGVIEAKRRVALAELAGLLPGVAMVQPDGSGEAGWLRAPALMTAPQVAEIDLTLPARDRMARQQGKWRNRLRKAQVAGLSIRHRPLNMASDADLLAKEAEQREARRYAALPPAFLHHWAAHFPGATRLFTAHAGKETVAYMLFLLHAPVATYHIGWSGDAGRRVSAHHLLLWRASDWLASHGFARLDLGTVDTETAPGLARFKIGSGARIRALGPTLLPLPRFLRHPSALVRAFPLAFRRNHS